MKKILFFLIAIFCAYCAAESVKNISFKQGERIIVFAPHPDDEILGCAGLIQKAIKNECDVYVVYLTNGDHNQIPYRIYDKKIITRPTDYIKLGEIRRKESINATSIIGIPQQKLIFLGYPDFGCLKIWEEFWGENKRPFMSFLTRARSVPYKENFSYGRPYISDSILNDIKTIIQQLKPEKIFITSPFDTNVDHRALYNFIRAATLEIKDIKPEIFLYIIHFKKFPQKNVEFITSLELPFTYEIYNVYLDDEERQKKSTTIECFKSQTIFKKNWFYSFVKKNEVFYREKDIKINEFQNITLESEKEAEFQDYKNLSYPFYCSLKKDGEFLNVEFIQKDKIETITNYIFYFFPFKNGLDFASMPKTTINLKKEEGRLSSVGTVYHEKLVYEKTKNKFSFRVNLSSLNYPDYLFFSANIKVGGISYDFIPWELIKIE